MSCYPYTDSYGRNKIKLELDLSNYAKKSYLIGPAKKVGVASLKSVVDKLDIGKLETGPADLNKLSKLNTINWIKKLVLFKLLMKEN